MRSMLARRTEERRIAINALASATTVDPKATNIHMSIITMVLLERHLERARSGGTSCLQPGLVQFPLGRVFRLHVQPRGHQRTTVGRYSPTAQDRADAAPRE
jgi:hypothetical protein